MILPNLPDFSDDEATLSLDTSRGALSLSVRETAVASGT